MSGNLIKFEYGKDKIGKKNVIQIWRCLIHRKIPSASLLFLGRLLKVVPILEGLRRVGDELLPRLSQGDGERVTCECKKKYFFFKNNVYTHNKYLQIFMVKTILFLP